LAQDADNRFEHVVRAQQHLVVPEPQYLEAGPLQRSRPTGVVRLLLAMLATVELYDQMVLDAAEVGVIAGDRVLATEFDAQPGGAQVGPEPGLGIGLVFA
jgi:hypothetical protein